MEYDTLQGTVGNIIKAQKKKHKVPRTVAKYLIITCLYLSDLVFPNSMLWHG